MKSKICMQKFDQQERGHADHGWLKTSTPFRSPTITIPSTWGSAPCASSTRIASRRAGLRHASASRHGDHLLRARGRARAQGLHGHRLGDPPRRRAAHERRHRRPAQRVQSVADERRALPADLDPARPERGIKPSYEQKTFSDEEKRGRLRLVASPDGARRIGAHPSGRARVRRPVRRRGKRGTHDRAGSSRAMCTWRGASSR